MSRCLALRAAGIGDLLTAVPALTALAAHGEMPVTVAAPAWLGDLVALVPGVRGHVATRGLRPVTHRRPDLAVNLHGSGPQSHAALRALGPGRLWAYRCEQFADGPTWREHEPERQRWCRLLEWYGVRCDADDLALLPPPGVAVVDRAVVLHVGGSDPSRRWAGHQWRRLAAELAGDGYPVVVTGGHGDVLVAAGVVRGAGLPSDAALAGRLSLAQLAAVVVGARLVVSGDTGAAHLASAYGTPSVVVFGPQSPLRWGPPPRPQHVVLRGPGARPAAGDVPLPEVLAAARQLLTCPVAA